MEPPPTPPPQPCVPRVDLLMWKGTAGANLVGADEDASIPVKWVGPKVQGVIGDYEVGYVLSQNTVLARFHMEESSKPGETCMYYKYNISPQFVSSVLTHQGEYLWKVNITGRYKDMFGDPWVETTETQLSRGLFLVSPKPHFMIEKTNAVRSEYEYYRCTAPKFQAWIYGDQIEIGMPVGTLHTPPRSPGVMYLDMTITLLGLMSVKPRPVDEDDYGFGFELLYPEDQ